VEKLVIDQKVVGICYGRFWRFHIPKCRGIKIAEGHWKAGAVEKTGNGATVMISGYSKGYRVRQYVCWAVRLFIECFNKSFGIHAGEVLFDITINGE
jgi:hypothetical protein